MNEVTPDTLMTRFQGRGLKSIIIFTIVAHVVVLLGSSVPYLVKSVFGASRANMSKDERIKAAVQEATASIRKIAADYELNPQEVSDQFSGAGSRTAAVSESATTPEPENTTNEPVAEVEPERPKSAIEQAIEVKATGPDKPAIEDDIF